MPAKWRVQLWRVDYHDDLPEPPTGDGSSMLQAFTKAMAAAPASFLDRRHERFRELFEGASDFMSPRSPRTTAQDSGHECTVDLIRL